MVSNFCSLLLFMLCFQQLFGQTPPQQRTTIRLDDNSDWWSITKGFPFGQDAKEQRRSILGANFRISGITLDEGLLKHAMDRLGAAKTVKRGDAGESRDQLCYVSNGENPNTYLIFETGEVNYAFYLFQGKPWKGSDNCQQTDLVSSKLSTGSGVHLGQSPADAMAILGKPSRQRADGLVYLLSARMKNTPANLQKIRKQHPEMSEKEINDNFGVYDLTATVVLKFTDSKLTYIAISKSETY